MVELGDDGANDLLVSEVGAASVVSKRTLA